jgi:hypothetical protein
MAAARAAREVGEERHADAPPHLGQRWAWRRAGDGAASPFLPEPQGLQEGERDLAQQRVMVQAAPTPALEVVEAEFLFQLLMGCSQHQRALIAAASCPRLALAG